MTKPFVAFVVAAGLTSLAVPAAYAYDYHSDVRSDWDEIRRDRAGISSDVRKVQEEREELATARQHQRWAWWHGNFWAAHRAAERAGEERAELATARRKLDRDVADIRSDRADLRADYEAHRPWWRY